MFNQKHICAALAVVFAGGFGFAAQAQQAQQDQKKEVTKVERVEVTGSNIRRTDTETVAPVEVITREQIQRTGQPTIADVLRNLPANSGGSFGESFTNSFAPGAAGLSLRGLGQKTTLVLINGRRTAGYGFAQNLQDTFVDINSIPSSAVERVEILKDGASAIYGSDAIAGVYNIILRRDYKGVEFGGTGGQVYDKTDYRLNATAGYGDLGADRFNVFGVVDYYKRDLIMLSDTDWGKTRDFRGRNGGRNFTSLTGGGTWRQLTATNTLTNNHQAIAGCRGTVLTGDQAVAAGLIAAPLGNAAFNLPGNTFCSFDFNSQFTALPKTERLGTLVRGVFDAADNLQAYAEVGLSSVKTFQKFQAPFFAGTTGLSQTSVGLRPFTYNINFGPGVAGNPFSTNARYVGVLQDMGTRDTEVKSDTIRSLIGAKYSFANIDFDSGVGYSKNEVTSTNTNRLRIDGTSAVFGVTTAAQPPVPVSAASTYNLNNFASNSQAVRDQIRANFDRVSTSELTTFDTKGSTTFGRLPGGQIGLAVGVEYREEKLKDAPAAIAQQGLILGQGITATNAKRDNTAVFAEMSLPVLPSLEAQLAARSDRYSDYGSSTTPKVGAKWRPNSVFLARANWGKGFRAPTLPEISPSVATFFTSVIDPATGAAAQISGVFSGNPNLKAETSESSTIGFVIEPSRMFSIGVDWYSIDWKNIVRAPSFQGIVNACPATFLTGTQVCGLGSVTRGDQPTPTTAGPLVSVVSNYQNQALTTTQGVDLDARVTIPTEYGRFTWRTNGIYVTSFKENGTEVAGTNGGSNTIPRVKGTTAVDWDFGRFAVTGRLNYTSGWYQQLLPASYFTPQDPRFQTGVMSPKTPSYTTLDLFGRYEVIKNLNVSVSINNVMDKAPPYDPGFSGTFLYDFSQFDSRGRQVRVGFSYRM
ncbi:MAG TPA: TonB-dependent receptor [Burkholderiaceae bacterium]|nr:TonB-dependent receptor [Burkholderiaceae bacterium]